IAASGAVGPPDWQTALRLLVVAAERGWTPALAQLRVLAATCREDSRHGDLESPPTGDPRATMRAPLAHIAPSPNTDAPSANNDPSAPIAINDSSAPIVHVESSASIPHVGSSASIPQVASSASIPHVESSPPIEQIEPTTEIES